MSVSGPFCGTCGSELVEYIGFEIKSGDGEWYCKKCEESDGIPEEVDSDEDITPHHGISWPPDWDLSFMKANTLSSSTDMSANIATSHIVLIGTHNMKFGDTVDAVNGLLMRIKSILWTKSVHSGLCTEIDTYEV